MFRAVDVPCPAQDHFISLIISMICVISLTQMLVILSLDDPDVGHSVILSNALPRNQ